ncbi:MULTISPECIES: hypothetical protein [unclassified Lentimonas]|uniref:hypothetical protein n=1 Tax=unclassified Lentimonas TaxID=2630993 RepID=UPI00132BF593|nr:MULTISPECIES: hypothetical protein [unclassified Lentimonas]CAA6676317.1 Unannotated [Lentimonas sp. CC4]CAA6683793.1 Unannotated [Lentimonas sp. CC6]CAA7077812.1 Unannotated [Lentimonas sp. CC4]CAA7169742.1 Unannotated [Lentimonas sp. CC21]CAA7179859.1 Unannotated [Lentimonas sp. CC8]
MTQKAIYHNPVQVLAMLVCLFIGTSLSGAQERLILDMVHHNPGDTPYDSAFNDPAVLKEIGYNGKVYFLFESPMLAINWESVDADILPQGSPEREWVDAKAAEILGMQAAAKAEGLSVFAMSDLVLFPKRLIQKYGMQKTYGDPKHPQTEKLIRAQINEMFDQFPSMDGLVVRIGETYLQDAPYHQGHINDKTNAEATIIPLMQILREEICVKRNKTLIFRTWRAFDDNAARYQAVSDAIEPHPNLVISIKHCEGDFFRQNPYSRCIGMGRHRQIIEVQCAREYEGKGAYPNYIAHGVIDGFAEHAKMPSAAINSLQEFYQTKPELFGGVWTWSRGGGWAGPYLKDELWCDLNAWVMAQWAKDPSQSEASVFNRYATERLNLKGDDLAKFRQLCLLSTDAVVLGRYAERGGFRGIWTRDQGISWPRAAKNPATQQRILQQKDEAIAIWKEILELAQSIEWADDATREYAIGSAEYGLRLYEIYRSIIYLSDAEANGDQQAMADWIAVYDAAWLIYNKLPQRFPSVATLYTKDYSRFMKNNADLKVEALRAQLDVPVASAAEVVVPGGIVYQVSTLDGGQPNKKTLNAALVSQVCDPQVTGLTDVETLKAAGDTLSTYANSEWAGFSLASNNGVTIDSAKELERGYFEVKIEALAGSKMNCSALTFLSARGGASQSRGYVLYASVNGAPFRYGDQPIASVVNEIGTRAAPSNVTVNLNAPLYQGIESITFRYYPLTANGGLSMDFNDMTLYGTVTSSN